MIRLDFGACLFCILLGCRYRSGLVSAWSYSPTRRGRTIIAPSSFRKHRERSRWYRPSSRLHRDFIDGGGDNNDGDESGGGGCEPFSDFDFVVGDDAGGASDDDDDYGAADRIPAPKEPPPSSSMMSVLQQRFEKISSDERMDRKRVSDNLEEGYWGVWGCSLDPYGTEEERETKTVVTCLRQQMPSFSSDDDDSILLVVGRSDGSILWLQMEGAPSTSVSSSPSSTSPSDNDPRGGIENRSVTTYFENKLVAKPTDDGGMIVDTALRRRENDDSGGGSSNADVDGSSSPRLPFDILAQIRTAPSSTASGTGGAEIAEILPIPSARMVWTVSSGAPNSIRGWNLAPDDKTGFLLPSSSASQQQRPFDLEAIHTSPIVGLKIIPNRDGDHDDDDDESTETLVVSVSEDGRVVVWGVTASSVRIRVDADLLRERPDDDDSVLSVDVDDRYLYLGTERGAISIFSHSSAIDAEEEEEEHADGLPARSSLPLVKTFVAFTDSRDPGVSSLLAAGDVVDDENDGGVGRRPLRKSLIAGSASGGLKQWELIPVGDDGRRLEHWPRIDTQKLPGGKPHVFETTGSVERLPGGDADDSSSSSSPAITELLRIRRVLLAATDRDLTAWDTTTGKALYDMRGLDFNGGGVVRRPGLVAANDSVLVTNGMENRVCVHDFTVDRVVDSESAEMYLERDDDVDDDDDGSASGW